MERASIETLENLQIPAQNGRSFPLAAIATFHYEMEQPIIWRRNRVPTITVKAALVSSVQPATVVDQIKPQMDALLKQGAKPGYAVTIGDVTVDWEPQTLAGIDTQMSGRGTDLRLEQTDRIGAAERKAARRERRLPDVDES